MEIVVRESNQVFGGNLFSNDLRPIRKCAIFCLADAHILGAEVDFPLNSAQRATKYLLRGSRASCAATLKQTNLMLATRDCAADRMTTDAQSEISANEAYFAGSR